MLKMGCQRLCLLVLAAAVSRQSKVLEPSHLLPALAAAAERAFQKGKGRERKLVTEDWKPVGSGRFRDQTRDCFCIPGLFLSLLIQDRPTSVSLLCTEVNSRHPYV